LQVLGHIAGVIRVEATGEGNLPGGCGRQALVGFDLARGWCMAYSRKLRTFVSVRLPLNWYPGRTRWRWIACRPTGHRTTSALRAPRSRLWTCP